MFGKLLRPALIIGTLPVTLTNGTTADATQVMSDLNWIVNQVNANAAALATTALTNANNNFTVVQSGTAASAAANFPIASQVQNNVFNTLSSTLGTNTLTARIAALPLGAFVAGQVFSFIPSQTNTGAVGITIDAAGSSSIFSRGASLIGGELLAGVPTIVVRDSSKLNIVAPEKGLVDTGTFQSHATTGVKSITGIGFKPKVVRFSVGLFTNQANTTISFNWGTGQMKFDGTQHSTANAMDPNAPVNNANNQEATSCVGMIDRLGAYTYRSAFSSMDADGFSINVLNASNIYIVEWTAFG